MNFLQCSIFFLVILTQFYYSETKPIDKKNFTLTVVHFNDFHARFEETNEASGSCKDPSTCIGGFSRLYVELMEQKKRDNVLIFNAGDNYQGTLWYQIFGWNVTQHFLNKLPVDVNTIGNHEFDSKIGGLVPFMKSLKSPIVLSNIDDSLEPTVKGTYNKSIVLHKYGKKIGIIGAIASNTDQLSQTGKLKFLDEAESINKEAKNLQDCDILIALTHSGLDVDIEIAKKLDPKINLIVGGHSHSLLYNGKPPGIDQPDAPYPVVIKRENNRKVLIVQASCYSKYVGNLTITYDEKGEILDWDGIPIYLSHNKPQDPEINKEIEVWQKKVDAYGKRVIGVVNIDLEVLSCYKGECNIGNFFADAAVDYYKSVAEPNTWTYASISLINNGDMRISLPKGNITFNDMMTCTPFQNTIDVGELSGNYLKEALEYGAKKTVYQNNSIFRNFLQVSGLRFTIDLDKPQGSRITNLKVLCQNCTTPIYEDFNENKTYRVALPNFLLIGGDGYNVFKTNLKNIQKGPTDTFIYEPYIEKMSPIATQVEGRITILNKSKLDKIPI